MDKEFDNTNRGAAWPNEKKLSDNHPDLTGSINVDGKDYWLSVWKKRPTDSAKAPVIKLAVTEKTQQVRQKPQSQAAEEGPKPVDEFFEDLPF